MIKLIEDTTYRPADRARAAEIAECRRRNLDAGCELVERGGQRPPTFADLFDFACAMSSPGETWAIANADVHFDATLAKLQGRSLGLAVLAITRRESTGEVKTNAWQSQDAWIFQPKPAEDWTEKTGRHFHLHGADFELGRYGCDNRLAFELAAAGRHVFNVCGDIRVHHLHAKREPNARPWVPGPYVFCPPVPLALALSMGKPQGPR